MDIYFFRNKNNGWVKISDHCDVKNAYFLGANKGDIEKIRAKFERFNTYEDWYLADTELLDYIEVFAKKPKTAPPIESMKITKNTLEGRECRKLLDNGIPQIEDKVYSIAEAAGMLGVTSQTLRNWEASGRIKSDCETARGSKGYSSTQIRNIRKSQMKGDEFLFEKVKITEIFKVLQDFDPLEEVDVYMHNDSFAKKFRITISALDGLRSVSHSFNFREKVF